MYCFHIKKDMNVPFAMVWPLKGLGSKEFEINLLIELVNNIPIIFDHICVNNEIMSFK